MIRKYLNQGMGFTIDFDNRAKWQEQSNGRLKIVNPDYENDRLFTDGHFKIITKSEDENEKQQEGKIYISGIANANVIDRVYERCDPRGIELVNFQKNPTFLAHHNYYLPIGQVELIEVKEHGIEFRAWVGDPSKSELTDMQKEMRSLIKQGIIKTVSIGFIPKEIQRPTYNDNGDLVEPMVILKWELLEISAVAIPCNQDSVFTVDQKTVQDNNTIDKGDNMKVTIDPSKKSEGEDNEIKNFMNEIKTLLSGLTADMKTVVTNSTELVKNLKAAPKEDENEDEEDEEKKSIISKLEKIAEEQEKFAKALAIVWEKLPK